MTPRLGGLIFANGCTSFSAIRGVKIPDETLATIVNTIEGKVVRDGSHVHKLTVPPQWIKLRRCAACSIANGTPETRLQPRYAGSRGTGQPYQRAFKSNVQTIAYRPARAGLFILLSRFGAVNATRSRFGLAAIAARSAGGSSAFSRDRVVRVGREH